MAVESPVCTNWLEVGALGLHHAPKALYSVGLTNLPWKEPASNSLYDGAPSNSANLFLLSQVQYSPSLLYDKPGKILSFTRGRGNKLTGTFDPEAWLRGPTSTVLERELERESHPEPIRGPFNAEIGAEVAVLLPLALPETASSPTQAGCTACDATGPGAIVPVAEGTWRVVEAEVPLPLVLFETACCPRPAH